MSGPAATMAAASRPRALPCAAGRRSTQNVAARTATAMSSVMTRAAGEVLATVPRNVPGSSSLATVPPGEWFSNSPVPAESTGATLKTKSGRYCGTATSHRANPAIAPHPPEQPDTAQGEHHQVDLPFVDVGCHRLEGDRHENEQDCRLPVLDAERAKCRDQEHDQ